MASTKTTSFFKLLNNLYNVAHFAHLMYGKYIKE